MAQPPPAARIEGVRDPGRIKRYTLIPRSSPGQRPDGVRRYSLARVGATPRSVHGDARRDRLERMERIAEAERRLDGADRRRRDGDGDQPRRS